jgi:DNA-binding NarL/FixJ family response regulator
MGKGELAGVLVVDDEEGVGWMVRKYFRPRSVTQAYTVEEGHSRFVEMHNLAMAIVDLNLPGSVRFDPARPRGGAFELAKRMRDERPALSVVIFSAHVSSAIVNYAHLIGVDFVSKVEAGENLRALAGRLGRGVRRTDEIARLVMRLAERHRLSDRETEVARLAMLAYRIREMGEQLALSPNTVKRVLERVRAKSGLDRDALVRLGRGELSPTDSDRRN